MCGVQWGVCVCVHGAGKAGSPLPPWRVRNGNGMEHMSACLPAQPAPAQPMQVQAWLQACMHGMPACQSSGRGAFPPKEMAVMPSLHGKKVRVLSPFLVRGLPPFLPPMLGSMGHYIDERL